MNEFEMFEKKYGDYRNFSMQTNEIVEEYLEAFGNGEQKVETLLLEDGRSEFEEAIYDGFLSTEPGGLKGIFRMLSGDYRPKEDLFAEFINDLEFEDTDEKMIYRVRYDPF